MSTAELLTIVPGSPVLSGLILFIIALLMLYLARAPSHRAIRSVGSILHSAMRIASRSVLRGEQYLVERNREVLLAAGREAVERSIEREFQRVDAVVKRDLSAYPALQLKLSEQITLIDEDYRESTELPPPSPAWVGAVKAVANIQPQGDGTVADILMEIQESTEKQYKKAMNDYRDSMGVRHALLKKMMPHWRKLAETLYKVGKNITGLQERAKVIDRRMDEYEQIRAGSVRAQQTLTSSSMTQFVISGFVLLIAFGGAVINFNLIALPMSEMVGGASYIGRYPMASVAAMVIILLEVSMGLYLMESIRITNLFPIIGSMDDRMRRKMIWITFAILLVLACVESSLAFMREQIAADMEALRHTLTTSETIQPVNSWIPTVGQMVMGFILPFALTFVAIPLESFVNASRTVGGVVAAAALRWMAFMFRLLGNTAKYLSEFLVNVYDVLIFPPLYIERLAFHRTAEEQIHPQEGGL
jgi:hypothetical protein